MSVVADKAVAVHEALDDAGLSHAFGGALALAWCTADPRGTSDIDVNIFVPADEAAAVLDSLPPEVTWTEQQRDLLERDGQVRLFWGETPVDVFLNTDEFHLEAEERSHVEQFAGVDMPFLSCNDLAVFKAFFNRTRDWADLEDMAAAGTLDIDRLGGLLLHYFGSDDERIARLETLRTV